MVTRIPKSTLVTEAIMVARIRKQPLPNGTYQGSKVVRVITLLTDWIDPKDLTETCNHMMRAGTLTVIASKAKYVPGSMRPSDRDTGRLDRFHPGTPLISPHQYFSESGIPLGTSFKNRCLRVHSQGEPYWEYSYKMFYLTVDGIPGTVPKNYIQV